MSYFNPPDKTTWIEGRVKTKAHTHRAIERLHREQGWTHCVTPVECAAKPERQSAHGGLIYTDTCACGAVRFTEANYPYTNHAPWQEPEQE